MDANLEFLKPGARGHHGRWLATGAMLAVGMIVTAALFLALGLSTRPGTDAGKTAASPSIENPFAAEAGNSPGPESEDPEACEVMSTAIEDINARMSEGVTEAQARYFRARRNQLYMMLRERCGA